LIGENSREEQNDSFGLNIWWNLNILRDALKGSGQSNLVLLSPVGVSGAYASSLLRREINHRLLVELLHERA